ncbi:hypothetical protein BC826DRAFT_1183272, partial [Russula brevipes]
MNVGSVTVHALSPVARCQVQHFESESDSTRDATLLSRGRAIAHAGCGTTGWRTPNPRELQECLLKSAFIYLPPPPLVPAAAALVASTVKEWDAPPSESEQFSVVDLQPFESVSFCRPLRSCPPVGSPAVASKEGRDGRWLGGSSPGRPPAKRTKVEVDTGPLDELIPPPHYVPAPLKPTHLALPPTPPDTCASFVPIPPQTTSSAEAVLTSIYSRVAWVIPVRGLPPWDGVSGASVSLGQGHHLSEPPGGNSGRHPSARGNSDIVWTRGSLRRFWTFLGSYVEMPGSVAGSLSLSFHAAAAVPHSDPTGSQRQRGTTASPDASACLASAANRETEMTASDPSPPSLVPITSASKSRLADIDYVKVYCDAPQAMLVRQALGQWAYREDSRAEGPMEGIRILEFAKLVL